MRSLSLFQRAVGALFFINIVFDNKGKLSHIKNQKYETQNYSQAARNDRNLSVFVKKVLEKDQKISKQFND